jgi:hypothetical protein
LVRISKPTSKQCSSKVAQLAHFREASDDLCTSNGLESLVEYLHDKDASDIEEEDEE